MGRKVNDTVKVKMQGNEKPMTCKIIKVLGSGSYIAQNYAGETGFINDNNITNY